MRQRVVETEVNADLMRTRVADVLKIAFVTVRARTEQDEIRSGVQNPPDGLRNQVNAFLRSQPRDNRYHGFFQVNGQVVLFQQIAFAGELAVQVMAGKIRRQMRIGEEVAALLRFNESWVVTDVGSVKGSVVKDLEKLIAKAGGHFVGSHAAFVHLFLQGGHGVLLALFGQLLADIDQHHLDANFGRRQRNGRAHPAENRPAMQVLAGVDHGAHG